MGVDPPVTETTLRASPHTDAVVNGRRLAARTMRTWSLLDGEEAVTAIVAELVANAVRHAGTPLELRLLRKPGRVRVEVRDRSSALPKLHEPEPLGEGRRGLFLVDRYSSSWGVELNASGGGKVVWAEVAV
jgi:anti-sigma regulatory factor (Ser/Thr protein kinase)